MPPTKSIGPVSTHYHIDGYVMNKNYSLILVLLIFFISISCDDDAPSVIATSVEIFEIEEYETFSGTDQIDPSTVKIKTSPLFGFADLLSYNANEYKFKLSESAKKALEDNAIVEGAFAVMVNDELIYSGYFVPGYSSRLYAWYVIDPLYCSFAGECFVMRIEIAGDNQPSYDDVRNDSRILHAFKNVGKLVE